MLTDIYRYPLPPIKPKLLIYLINGYKTRIMPNSMTAFPFNYLWRFGTLVGQL
jgi:hypothetical protein